MPHGPISRPKRHDASRLSEAVGLRRKTQGLSDWLFVRPMAVSAGEVARSTLRVRGLLGRTRRSSSQEDEPWQIL